MPSFKLHKDERLKSRKTIESLFKTGKSFSNYPLRIVWAPIEQSSNSSPIQFTITVSKRSFKKAVDRNRIKRQVREAFRLSKHKIYDGLNDHTQQYAIMFIYSAREKLLYQEIDKALQIIIARFLKKIKKDTPTTE